MIGIAGIGTYIPQNFESNTIKKDKFSITDEFIYTKLGIEQVSRKSAEEETSDLCVKAFYRLQGKHGKSFDDIDCLVVCTQNPDSHGIPHTSAVVHGKLGLQDSCACFDISLGCSGYVYALSIVKAFMEANGMQSGLLFTSDPYSKIINPDDKDTVLLFGDAATVTLLQDATQREQIWMPKRFVFSTRGSEGDALHNRGGYIFMNGRVIFDFAVREVPLQVNKLLERVDMSIADIDLFMFHQGSKFIVDQLRRIMGLPDHKVPVKLFGQGNTVSSSLPLLMEGFQSTQDLQNIVMCGFGVGLSWASCLLRKS